MIKEPKQAVIDALRDASRKGGLETVSLCAGVPLKTLQQILATNDGDDMVLMQLASFLENDDDSEVN